MHLLATTSGVIDGAAEAIDLAQSPADIVVLSAADSELAALARAHDGTPCPLRLANLLQLQHPLSVDLYVEKTLSHAKLIVLRILGGASYWSYGLDQVEATARERGIKLCLLPGDAQPDPDLTRRSTLEPHHCERLRHYLVTGGAENATAFLAYCRHVLEATAAPAPARELPKAGLYRDTSIRGRSRKLPSSSTAPCSRVPRPRPSTRLSRPCSSAASAPAPFMWRASRTAPRPTCWNRASPRRT
jgi:cobaltochelatase CobN